jgi:hypothetical protein
LEVQSNDGKAVEAYGSSVFRQIFADGLRISVKTWKKLENKPSGNIPGKNRELAEPTGIQIQRIRSDLDYHFDDNSQ